MKIWHHSLSSLDHDSTQNRADLELTDRKRLLRNDEANKYPNRKDRIVYKEAKVIFTTFLYFVDCSEFEKMLQQGLDTEFLLEWIKNIYDQFSVVVSIQKSAVLNSQ